PQLAQHIGQQRTMPSPAQATRPAATFAGQRLGAVGKVLAAIRPAGVLTESFQFPANGAAMARQRPADAGVAESSHLLMEDTIPVLIAKMSVGHRCSGLSTVESW